MLNGMWFYIKEGDLSGALFFLLFIQYNLLDHRIYLLSFSCLQCGMHSL